MKLFYYANIRSAERLANFQAVSKTLKSYGLTVWDNTKEQEDFDLESLACVEELDVLILDASGQEAEVGYLLAMALTHKKPVLYLLPKGTLLDPAVKSVAANKDMKRYLTIEFYPAGEVNTSIQNFLRELDQDLGKEIYSVKFTLRLSTRLERYLNWKSDHLDKNKADFVRNFLEEMLKHDELYKNRLTDQLV